MKAFFGVNVTDEVREVLSKIAEGLKGVADVTLVAPENLHVTLKYLGNVHESMIKKAHRMKSKRFEASLLPLGTFPNKSNPRVVWAGVWPGPQFRELNEDLCELYGKDKKRYHPHITLARVHKVYDQEAFEKFLSQAMPQITFNVHGFKAYESTLTAMGPVYNVLENY